MRTMDHAEYQQWNVLQTLEMEEKAEGYQETPDLITDPAEIAGWFAQNT